MKRRTFPRLLAAAAAVLILLGIGAYAASPFFSYQESVATLSKVGSQGDEVRKIQTRLKEAWLRSRLRRRHFRRKDAQGCRCLPARQRPLAGRHCRAQDACRPGHYGLFRPGELQQRGH